MFREKEKKSSNLVTRSFIGYRYAALQYQTDCYCGQSYGRHGSNPESECSMTCSGDPSRTCVGGFASEVYGTNGGLAQHFISKHVPISFDHFHMIKSSF